jgi:hypothetical protein
VAADVLSASRHQTHALLGAGWTMIYDAHYVKIGVYIEFIKQYLIPSMNLNAQRHESSVSPHDHRYWQLPKTQAEKAFKDAIKVFTKRTRHAMHIHPRSWFECTKLPSGQVCPK